MKALVKIEENIPQAGAFTTSHQHCPVDDDLPHGAHHVYGAEVTEKKSQNVQNWIGGIVSRKQDEALLAVLCGCYHTGVSSNPEYLSMAAKLRKSLGGNYRSSMSGKTAPIVAAALRGLHGEELKQVRGGGPADFAQVLRNLADAIESGANLENVPLATGKIPKDH